MSAAGLAKYAIQARKRGPVEPRLEALRLKYPLALADIDNGSLVRLRLEVASGRMGRNEWRKLEATFASAQRVRERLGHRV